ncbi:MAG TPA: enoyl-CoA hydratase/isomerase family protein [Acidimicrobiales bacterium]|nr:enoyl-CoA hydratase/isomerase family protein [Acidimicrobiales bacterium]
MSGPLRVETELDPATFVGVVEFENGPANALNPELLGEIGAGLRKLAGSGCRAVVLRSTGRHFCAGADLSGGRPGSAEGTGVAELYAQVPSLFEQPLPMVAAVQGAAIGGGLGLALVADFRVASPEARFSANFAVLGFHCGFALSETLPEVVGRQRAAELLLTGRRITGEEAFAIGLCDRLVPAERLVDEAVALAGSLAAAAPLAVTAMRRTLRGDVGDRVRRALVHERAEQERLMTTGDFREGVRASRQRRAPEFRGA